MANKSCSGFTDRLVDYADGELPDAERREIAAHLDVCPECRVELAILVDSLDAAREVWHESVGAALRGGPRRHRKRLQPVRLALAATAAALLLAAVTWFSWPTRRSGTPCLTTMTEKPSIRRSDRRSGTPCLTAATAATETPSGTECLTYDEDIAEIEAAISRAERRARLEASIAILATQPDLDQIRRNAERYVAETFGDPQS